MKLRLWSMIGAQFWFIIFAALIGGGLIYFLNSIGVIEAMRNDRTIDGLYESNLKLPKAPYQKLATVNAAETTARPLISEPRQLQIAAIDVLIEQFENNATSNRGVKSQRDTTPLIPHIIHQTWDSYNIPETFVKNIRSCVNLHPSWEYWFWTRKAVKCFLKRHYSNYVQMYDAYTEATSKADAMRYFVLHKYGGVYADLDTTCLKPLDVWTHKFCCILTEEPYEHSFIVRKENKTSIVNSPMACQSNHKLFQTAVTLLPQYAAQFFWDYIKSTGPAFLANVFKTYQMVSPTASTVDSCSVTVTPPKYFLPRFDPSQSEVIDKTCSLRYYKSLPKPQKKVCSDLIDRNYKNLVTESSFMDHKWLHVALLGEKWKNARNVNLFSVFPNAKNLEEMFCN